MKIRIAFTIVILVSIMLGITACGSNTNDNAATETSTLREEPKVNEAEVNDTKSMVMKIGEIPVDITWEDNASVEELKSLADSGLTIPMSMYGGFEQVGPIGTSITRDDKQTTTSAGDVVLYSGNQLVVFYGSNSWAYTRLGKINLSEKDLIELLSNGDVTITLHVE
ncbi:cyclophilin-like fold protein [Pseudobutyrivibrio xylanivorans]|uniref:Cyclophilin-like domain-containing protein n=1 Tax=Pseudobutyrivibrio xylanivorans TaxID=185007 RepID=A0A5P6VSE8_PSEXY|nr:cyclophilin-like fold protein [Pseudobutyrivibrio xylanivorans]QFJ55332.1 hypothetical protein FXF36_10895 [Pseudobutyrivibrio xylanivorans]